MFFFFNKNQQENPKQNFHKDVENLAIDSRCILPYLGRISTTLQVRWVKLNPKGFSLGNPKPAGCGGLIRNTEGVWAKGFSKSTGSVISVAAGLDVLRKGLLMNIQLNIQGIVIEFDACYESNFIYLVSDKLLVQWCTWMVI